MAYQGDASSGRDYWPGYDASPAYDMQNGRAATITGAVRHSSQYQNGAPALQQPQVPQQHWEQAPPHQNQYAIPANYAPSQNYALNPMHIQYEQPQHPSYAQHPQYLAPQYSQYSNDHPQRQPTQAKHSTLNVTAARDNRSTFMAPPSPNVVQLDQAMLLASLAEEFFDAAHNMAPSVVKLMDMGNVATYQKLISTGLGCLEAALKHMKLAPRIEATVRLRYAGVLYEETDDLEKAERSLSTGIALCERVCFLKYLAFASNDALEPFVRPEVRVAILVCEMRLQEQA